MERKKHLFAFIFHLLLAYSAWSQVTFQKGYKVVSNSVAQSIQQTFDGGYIVTGMNDLNVWDVFLLRTDSFGNMLWTKTYGGLQYDIGLSVQQTYDSGFVIAGPTLDSGGFNEAAFLIKTNYLGDTLWTKRYNHVNGFYAFSVIQTKDSGYLICGGGFDLIKTDASGNVQWAKDYGGTNWEIGHSVQQTSDGGFIVTGLTESFGAINANAYLIKTDSAGNVLWSKMYDSGHAERAESVQQTSDGGYIINCWTWNQFGVLIKTDSSGTLMWSKQFDGTGALSYYTVRQTHDGGYILADGHSTYGNGDAYLIKTDSAGNLIWSKVFDVSGPDEADAAIPTSDGGYIVAGYAQVGFPSTYIYLIKTDSNGISGCHETSAPTIETTPVTIETSVATIVTNLLITIDNPGFAVNSGGIVTNLCDVGVNELLSNYLFNIYPNPSATEFTISFSPKFLTGEIAIYNSIGEIVLAENIFNESKKEINLKKISNGIYLVKVFDGEKNYSKKLIVEHD